MTGSVPSAGSAKLEGVFRQAVVYKGRNRDTAWYSIIDTEWPAVCAAFESWLAPDNFDEHGLQRKSLARVRDEQMITRPVTLPENEKTALTARGRRSSDSDSQALQD
jgi:hypothetical protein